MLYGYTECRRIRDILCVNGVCFSNVPLGGSSEAVPPVPISNTVVKRLSAYDTALAKVWENKSLPGGLPSQSLFFDV